jgi:catechol 2,3-dioxygenase-like lactoylglutathione lyase family enzyme
MQLTVTAIFVEDIEISKEFYVDALKQKVVMESKGAYVSFESGLALWQTKMATETIFGAQKSFDGQSFEICFETETLEEDFKKVTDMGAGVISKIEPQPWGQMVFRIFDPDGHIIEIAEPLAHTIQRFLDGGYSHEQVSQITHLPIEVIEGFTAQPE